MPKILIPTPLRQYTGKQDTVQVNGGTVGEALAALTQLRDDPVARVRAAAARAVTNLTAAQA